MSKYGDAIGGHDRARLGEFLEVAKLEGVVWVGGAKGAQTLFIG